ncbi:MAG TPA: helix-turn-helix transcriptional regulator [Tepidisphaeraceae bacterium]|nr:helix-turn-helix transcriptional regulator [Tepidisphaeraceae bacterium]
MKPEIITRGRKRFVLLPLDEYERLAELPPLPPVAADGTSNAIDYARASIARQLITDRRAAGLSQHELARRAGVRQETISRIESAKHTASVRVIDKLDRAIRAAMRHKPPRVPNMHKPPWSGSSYQKRPPWVFKKRG